VLQVGVPMYPKNPYVKGLVPYLVIFSGGWNCKKVGGRSSFLGGCMTFKKIMGLFPLILLFLLFLVMVLLHHALCAVMCCFLIGAKAAEPTNHGLNHPKLWAKIDVFSSWIDYPRHFVTITGSWLIQGQTVEESVSCSCVLVVWVKKWHVDFDGVDLQWQMWLWCTCEKWLQWESLLTLLSA
jgi:hypothetical protein